MTIIHGDKRSNEELEDYFELESVTKRSKKRAHLQDYLSVSYWTESLENYRYPNVVCLSHKTLVKIGNPAFIQIGRYVVPVKKDRNVPQDEMRLFELLKANIIDTQPRESRKYTEVVIRPFSIDNSLCAFATKIKFEVHPWREFDYLARSNKETPILEQVLRRETRMQLGKQAVRIGQEFFIRHPVVGPLKLVVRKCKTEDDENMDFLSSENQPEFGILTADTYLSYVSGDDNEILILEAEDPDIVQEFCMRIVKVKEIAQKGFASRAALSAEKDWTRGLEPLPVVLRMEELREKIFNIWEGHLIYPDKTVKFESEDRQYTVKFSHARVADEETIIPEGKNLKAFRLNRDHHIKLVGGKDVILTASEKDAQHAAELTFKIVKWKNPYETETNQMNWFNVDAIMRQLKKKFTYLPLKSRCSVNIGGHHLLLELVNAQGKKVPIIEGASSLWKLDKNTAISLFVEPELKIELVHATLRFPINTMQVIVNRRKDEDEEEGNFFSFKKPEDKTKLVLDEASINEAFRQALPADGFVSEKNTLYGITKKGEELEFKIRQIKDAAQVRSSDAFNFLKKVSPDTKISWVGEMNGDVIIERPMPQMHIERIHEELIEAGLGGLPKELEKFILEIKLSRGDYNPYMKDRGIKPTRGGILWGPPGTGKTQIARNLGKMLGISEERTKLYTGSEIWDKWVGNSEKNVRKMFAAAREEQNRLGDKSKMHLLIIDEIDAFLQKRESAKNRWETSVITTFLAELDGVTSTGKEPLNNILVIGMTNQPRSIDEAVKREGRLGTHIHIGLPEHQGRKEIFMIHAKPLISKGCLSDDIDFDKLAELSSGKTGAYIEGIVAKAAKYHVIRLQEAKIEASQAANHNLAKVTMADFKQAIKETADSSKPKKQKGEEFIPIQGASIETITANLRRLGIVGIPAEAMQFIRDCKISQNYKKLELPSAVLLYGHSGTGKSSIARSLEKLLDLDGKRFQQLTASQLWPKHGIDLKETIDAIILPAKNASRDLGKAAPLHVIVIDEIDWIYSGKRLSEQESGAMMGQFLREVQNLFHAEGFDANNLMIVGIASGNVPVEILKTFNIGTSAKLVEVKLPNSNERREILSYYLEEFITEGRISEKTLHEIVEITKDKPGAFIRALIKETVNGMYRRASDLGVPDEELGKHSAGKLHLDYFRESYAVLAGEERWRNSYN